MADQISDSVLDAILAGPERTRRLRDPDLRPAWSWWPARSPPRPTWTIPSIVRQTIVDIGYDRAKYGFDGSTCGVTVAIDEQSLTSPRVSTTPSRSGRATSTRWTPRAPATRG